MDFNANPVSFDLTLTGTGADGTYNINLDEDWDNILDTDGNITTARERSDVLTYIQSELNDAGLAGVVTARFNSDNRLVLSTEPAAGSQTLTINNSNVTGIDYLGISDGSFSSGVSISSASFDLSYSNRLGSVSSASSINVADGTYQTSSDLANAIANAINADANIAAGAQGAQTEKGSRSLANSIDFTSDAAQIAFALNGTDYSVTVNSNGSDNLDSIQQAIDATVGAGQINASLSSNGLVLTTQATGSAQSLQIKQDGIGASTNAGSVDLSTGVDFSSNNASFTLQVDGTAIAVNVDGNGTSGSNDGQSNLSVIQQALDTALAAANGGGEFSSGDILAKLDASNQLYFETVSKNGVATEATFGADASIQITAADANANSLLGISSGAININGFDGFGLDKGTYQGFDSQAQVNYQQDADGKGRFDIRFANDSNITLSNLSLNATVQLGLSSSNQASTEQNIGVDVQGTINGIEAVGRGQYLTAAEGNEVATNGYLLGGTGSDFSSAEVIDGTNNSLKVVIDGVESNSIILSAGAYASGNSLAAELKTQINADSALQAAGKSVDVQYDVNTSTFGIFSVSKGEQSTVSVSDISSGGIDIFGFTTSTAGVNGKDAVGATDSAAGLMIKITGSRTGDRGNVNYIQGVMHKLDALFDDILSSSGVLTEKESNLSVEQENIELERTEIDERTAIFESRLRAKFLFNDKLISQLKTTEDFLSSQFEAMTASNKK